MAKENFSWLNENTLEVNLDHSLTNEEPSKLEKLLKKTNHHKRALIGLGVLVLILVTLKMTQKEESTPIVRLEAMAAAIAIPKGEVIEGMLLRPVTIYPSQISKAQKLQLLRPDDAEKIVGKLRAKKDIPPNKPIFWNELELIKSTPTTKEIIPVVTYPED